MSDARVALVAGAGGIGEAIGQRLARDGARVVLVDRDARRVRRRPRASRRRWASRPT